MANTAKTLNMEEKPFRVLTLDGGGMRGLYTATLLKVLSKRFDPRFHNKEPDIGKAFDLICGTSTGAILACALAVGVPLSRVKNLYIENGAHIFKRPLPKRKTSALCRWAWKHRNKPAAESNVLLKALTECFGDLTLRSGSRRRQILQEQQVVMIDMIQDFARREVALGHRPLQGPGNPAVGQRELDRRRKARVVALGRVQVPAVGQLEIPEDGDVTGLGRDRRGGYGHVLDPGW